MIDRALFDLQRVVESGGGTLEIDAALAPVAEAQDPESITPLLLLLRETDDDHGMWSIVHAAEQFDTPTYVSGFLTALPKVATASPYWASIVTMRVLNSDAARDELVRQLQHSSGAAKQAAKQVCEKINERDTGFLPKTKPVLASLG